MKVTKQTTFQDNGAILYEVLVGGQVRWHRRVRRSPTKDSAPFKAAHSEQDRVAARLAAAAGTAKVADVTAGIVKPPCAEKCRHSGCDTKRSEAEFECSICEEPIGYGRRYLYEEFHIPEEFRTPDKPNYSYTHADCAEVLENGVVVRVGTGLLINLRRWKLTHRNQVRRLERKAALRSRSSVVGPGARPRQVIPFPSPSKATSSVSEHPVPADAPRPRKDTGEQAQTLRRRARVGAKTSQTGRRAWHSVKEQVHHDNTKCDRGSKIPQSTRVAGTGNKPFCRNCARLHRETKVTEQTRYDKYGAWIYEVRVGKRVRWRQRVPRHHKLGAYSKAARRQYRAAARLTAAVRARTELKAH